MAKEELQKSGVNALARPDFLSVGDTTGTEHITQQDLKMPRLTLAQSLSKQIDPAESVYIENLKQGDWFNDLTNQIYGPGPIDFCIIRSDPPRWIEFFPRSQGGGVKDMDVQPGDPRTQFTKNDKNESVPPEATMFYDYVIMLLPSKELIALSLKSTGLAAARQLNGYVKTRNAPLYAGRYTVISADKQNKKGKFKIPVFRNSTTMDEASSMPGWVSKEILEQAKQLHLGLKGRKLDIAREPGDEDEAATEFDPSKMADM